MFGILFIGYVVYMDKKFKIILVSLGIIIVLLCSMFFFGLKREDSVLEDKDKQVDIVEDSNEIEEEQDDMKDEVISTEDDKKQEEDISSDDSSNSEEKKDTSLSESDSEDKKENNSSSNNNSSSSNNDNKNNQDSGSSNNNEPSKEPDKGEEEIPVVDENDVYRKRLESTYGIKIRYGDEIGDYNPKMLTPTRLLDEAKIKTNLGYLEAELKKYPSGFFRDFEGMPLTIYLVESVPNNAFAGFTDKQFMNDIKLTLVDDYSFSYTFNHEIMHYIDAYLEIKMYPNDPYGEYMSLNPEGFSYGSVNQIYNYGYNGQVKGAYFLNSYSQSDVREDRAEIFKQMITRVYKPVGMFDDGEVMKNKSLIISEQIKTYFPSAKGIQYWDKIIN